MDEHRDTMCELAKQRNWQRGIELGLGSGLLFRRMLAMGVRMIGVDIGKRKDRRLPIETLCRVEPRIEAVYWMSTNDAAPLVADGWADFIFIDACHSYTAVRDDIRLWQPKVRPGGHVLGHDYHPAFPGVIKAVDEAFPGAIMHPNYIWERP